MGGLRGQEILIIVILLILVFGWKKLPDAARSLGRSARVFKSEVEEMKKDGKDDAAESTVAGQAAEEPQRPAVSPPPAQSPPAAGAPAQYEPPAQPQQHQAPQSQPQAQPQQPQTYQQPGEYPDDPTRPVA